MENGKIRDLSNIYGNKPYGINIDTARKLAKESNVKGRSRKNREINNKRKKIKGYSKLLLALGLSGGVLFVASKPISNYFKNVELTELAKDIESPEFDLENEQELAKFSTLLLQTEYLLNVRNLTDNDKEILKDNLITISNNLGNVIDFTDNKIADLFTKSTGKPVFAKTQDISNSVDGPTFKTTVENEDISYTFISTENNSNIKSSTLKDLIKNQHELSAINNGNKAYAPLEKTFKLVNENFKNAKCLEDLSIHIDEKGNIIEDSKTAER